MTQSVRAYLDGRFESEEIKATLATDGVIGTNGGPSTPGTAYIMLHHVMGGATGVRGGPTCRFEYDGRCHWTIDDPAEKVTAQLVVDDFHPAVGFLPKSSSNVVSDFASNHSECNGRVTGELTVDGRQYKVDGLGIRDHSWGIRIWNRLRAHRWIAGVFDDRTGFCAMSWTGADGKLHASRLAPLVHDMCLIFARGLPCCQNATEIADSAS